MYALGPSLSTSKSLSVVKMCLRFDIKSDTDSVTCYSVRTKRSTGPEMRPVFYWEFE